VAQTTLHQVIKARLLDHAINMFISVYNLNKASLCPNLPQSYPTSISWLGVNSQRAHDTANNMEWQLPEAVLIQFFSPDDEHDMLETCREL